MPSTHIDTDHSRPVMMVTRAKRGPWTVKRKTNDTLNLKRLAEEPIRAAIKEEMNKHIQKVADYQRNIAEEWICFKEVLTNSI